MSVFKKYKNLEAHGSSTIQSSLANNSSVVYTPNIAAPEEEHLFGLKDLAAQEEPSQSNRFDCLDDKEKHELLASYKQAEFYLKPEQDRKRGHHIPQRADKDLYADEFNIQVGKLIDECLNIEIEVTGGGSCMGAVKHYQSFADCQFSDPLMKNITDKKYSEPMPIQKVVMPIIMEKQDYDLMAHSNTGSGKSAAYLLPIIQKIHELKEKQVSEEANLLPYAVIICPTYELATQLSHDAKAFCMGMKIRPVATYGRKVTNENIINIQNGCDILCTTPSQLFYLCERKILNLKQLKFLVFDEVDDLLKDQAILDLKRIREAYQEYWKNENVQTLMFGATYTTEVQKLVHEFLRPGFFYVTVGVLNSAVKSVEQRIMHTRATQESEHMALLLKLLLEDSEVRTVEVERDAQMVTKQVIIVPKTLIFVGTRVMSDKLAVVLSLKGIKSLSINGSRTMMQRENALEKFIKGDVKVLVATDLASRGLNIPNVSHVINYELPSSRETYIHRIGRTGRLGNPGKATSLMGIKEQDQYETACYLINVLTEVGQEVPPFLNKLAENET